MALFGDSMAGPVLRPEARSGQPPAQQAWFIGSRLALGAAGLAGVPVLLAATGGLAPLASAVVMCLVLQALFAVAANRGTPIDRLHAPSLFALCAALGLLACGLGGLGAPILGALPLVVLEAAMLGGRRLVGLAAAASAATLCVLAGLAAMSGAPDLPGQGLHWLQFAAILAASVGLALHTSREIALRSAQERQVARQDRLIAEGFGDLVTRHGPDGCVTFAADAAAAILAVPSAALVGRGLFERIHVADRPAFLAVLSEAMRSRSLLAGRIRIRCGMAGEDGRPVPPDFKWFEVRVQGVALDEAGARAEAVCVFRDVSEQRQHETDLDLARQQAESASEMKSRFLATVSHELRTPLNAIIGFSEMLASEKLVPADDARRRDYARMINISGQHLLEVVNTLLDISKIDSGTFHLDPEPVAVEEWVRDTVGMMRLKAEEAGVAVHARIEEGLPLLVADRRACKQILINLLSNAVKFTPRGGRVDIDVRRREGQLVLSVSDTGVGIAQEDLPRIGEPFFQSRSSYDRPYEGTGLGFSVVRGLVALHGGTISLDSAVGQGTRVSISLALDARLPGGPDQSGSQAPTSGSGGPVPLPHRGPRRGPAMAQDVNDLQMVMKRA